MLLCEKKLFPITIPPYAPATEFSPNLSDKVALFSGESLAPISYSLHGFSHFYLPTASTICPKVSEDGIHDVTTSVILF